MRDETLQDQEYAAAQDQDPNAPEGAVPAEADGEVEGVDDLFDFGSQESQEPAEIALDPEAGEPAAEDDMPVEEPYEEEAAEEAEAEAPAPRPRAARPQRSGLPTWMIAAATALVVVNVGIGAALAVRAIRRAKNPPTESTELAQKPEGIDPNQTPVAAEPAPKKPNNRPPVHLAPAKPRFPSIVSAASFAADDHPVLASAERLFAADKFSDARKRYFEVLLAPNPHFDGQDSALARLRIAQCLAREAAPPTAPVRLRSEEAAPKEETQR
jgi:hypothetical protein